jgi:hypothetical protein
MKKWLLNPAIAGIAATVFANQSNARSRRRAKGAPAGGLSPALPDLLALGPPMSIDIFCKIRRAAAAKRGRAHEPIIFPLARKLAK